VTENQKKKQRKDGNQKNFNIYLHEIPSKIDMEWNSQLAEAS